MFYINVSSPANQRRASSQPSGGLFEDAGMFLLLLFFLHFCYVIFSCLAF